MFRLACVIVVLCGIHSLVLAQGGISDTTHKLTPVEVTSVQIRDETHLHEAHLDDYITVNLSGPVSNLNGDKDNYILFIDGIPFDSLLTFLPTKQATSLTFQLSSEVNMASWDVFHVYPWHTDNPKLITIAKQGSDPIPSRAHLVIRIVRRGNFWFSIAVLIISIILLFVLSINTALLKDKAGRFSLSRTQLAFWTTVIVGSFLYVWVSTGLAPDVDGSTITLLLVSVGGTAGSKAIDLINQKRGTPMVKAVSPKEKGPLRFFYDIVSDSNGVSIHRFQYLAWTAAIGVVFVAGVIEDFEIPQLDTNLLALMGISAAGYVGLKTTE